ncbi:MAG: ADP-dependent glucokinase/phosphofructokinase [Candidatus Freyarchaeota archaeon]
MQAEEWARKYDRALSEVKESIKYCRMFVTGFNTNIDGLRHVEGEEIERIVTEKNLAGEIVSKLENPPREIRTLSDLLAGILFCAENGVGEEWFIRELEVFETIRSIFGYDRLRMGGQGGIMTNVLAFLDLKVIPNVVALPQIQAEQFTTGRGEILIPRRENGRIVFKNPLEAARESDKIFIHSIFEFDDRFCARVGGRTIRAPVDNRFIATYDDENVKVKVDPAFWEGTLRVIDRVGVAMLSGYHMLQSQYPDGSKPEDHIRNTIELIKSWRERNPELRIHTEIGFVADSGIRESILSTLTPHIDSIGLNEDELADNLYTLGQRDNLEEIRDMNAAQI